MKKILKKIGIVLILYVIYDLSRNLTGIQISPFERSMATEIGTTLHILLFYILPPYLLYKLIRKIAVPKTSAAVAVQPEHRPLLNKAGSPWTRQ